MDEVKKSIEMDNKQIETCFATPSGVEALAILDRLFFNISTYEQGDSYHTTYKSGCRDVVGFIHSCIETQREEEK